MPTNPKGNEERMLKILNGWKTIAPSKKFGGFTVEEYEAQVNKSLAPRQRLDALEDERLQELANRESEDVATMEKIQFIVNGVLADPSEGANSALYESFGYIRRDDRKSGLTRKRKAPNAPDA